MARGRRLALLALLALWIVPPAARHAAAQEEQEVEKADLEALKAARSMVQKRHPLSKRISRYMSAAAEAVDENDPAEAERLLLKLRPNRLNPLERAMVYRMLGVVSYGADQPEKAIGYFEQVLAEEALPIRDESRIRFNIAQIRAGLEDWQGVIDSLNEWLRYVENPDPLGFYLKGIAYYQLEDIDNAIAETKKAIAASHEPREPWLRLLAALYAQKGDYVSATPVLEELVLRFPKKQYWVQLSLIYGAREQYMASLAVQQVAYAQGLLTEDKELRRLARGYLYHDLPYPAAQVLEKGLADGSIEADPEAYELLANSWIAAREYDRSLDPLRKAARLSEGGKLYVRIGQVHMQREQWSEAAAMLEKAVAKGGLDNPGNAQLLLGICYYNSANVGRARDHFARARQYEDTRAEADRWITHIATESGSGSGTG